MISRPSHSYRHKHMNPTLHREQWHQAVIFIHALCLMYQAVPCNLFISFDTYIFYCSRHKSCFVRSGRSGVRAVCSDQLGTVLLRSYCEDANKTCHCECTVFIQHLLQVLGRPFIWANKKNLWKGKLLKKKCIWTVWEYFCPV